LCNEKLLSKIFISAFLEEHEQILRPLLSKFRNVMSYVPPSLHCSGDVATSLLSDMYHMPVTNVERHGKEEEDAKKEKRKKNEKKTKRKKRSKECNGESIYHGHRL